MTIDGDIGNYDYTQSKVMLVDFLAQHQYILNLDPTNLTTIQGLDNTCGYAAFREKYYTFPASGVQPPVFFSDHTQKACDIWTMAVTCAARYVILYDPTRRFLGKARVTSHDPIPNKIAYFSLFILITFRAPPT